ncbi:MAG: hypothetical protein M3Y50_14415 [Acidobacteriota bacterium]|nr:hypothetical protein [Acidobacteriota bacterium]
MKLHLLCSVSALVLFTTGGNAQIPKSYQGKPYHDATHTSGPQVIPGRLQAVLYDLGGEGVAYHDTDNINHGSGELNYTAGHCETGVPLTVCHFRENEGPDISYVKKGADLNHPSPFEPDWQQLYLGWEEAGEWTNYTVDVKKAGRYKIAVLYTHTAQTIQFSLNNQPAADCKLPIDPWTLYPDRHDPPWMIYHTWNKVDCGEITFPKKGLQLLTLNYKTGNNLAYFDFIPAR